MNLSFPKASRSARIVIAPRCSGLWSFEGQASQILVFSLEYPKFILMV